MFRKRYEGHLDRGAAAVEMAVVLPLLLLVLFGMIDFGRAFNTQMQLTQAAREAVRVKALGGSNDDAEARATAAWVGRLPAPTLKFYADCPTGVETLAGTPGNAMVTVKYEFEFITPLGPIASFFGASTLPGAGTFKTLSSDGFMRCLG